MNNDRIEDGHIGISFPIGLLVASYMFESKDIKGRLVFCRNYWEYTGNASEPTRIVLEVSSDADKWNVSLGTVLSDTLSHKSHAACRLAGCFICG